MPPHDGLTHLKEYDIKDSNVELIGSDIDHRVKYNSAATEPAWNNGIIGQTAGLYIWRIEDFSVISWPSSKTGSFYSGDSYIILHSYKLGQDGSGNLGHEVFFWLGSKTTQDEAGTAAYKTVELDEFLGGAATQHREVQQDPSPEFLHLFPKGITILSGGVRSGFRHVMDRAKEATMTLLRIFRLPGTVGRAGSIVVHEVEPIWQSLDDEDVFILEQDEKIYVWQGNGASPLEKGRAALVVGDMVNAKHIDVEVLAQAESKSKVVVDLLGGAGIDKRSGFKATRPMTTDGGQDSRTRIRRLFRITDSSGAVSFELVKEGVGIQQSDLDSRDIFLLDTGGAIWVWRGSGASKRERAMWIQVAQAYVRQVQSEKQRGDAHSTPVKTVAEGNEVDSFWKVLKA